MEDTSEWEYCPTPGSVWWPKTKTAAQLFVRLKHARVEENDLLCLFSCQFRHLSLVNLTGLAPNPLQSSGVAKDIGCLCFGSWSEPPEGGLMVKRWVMFGKNSSLSGIPGWASFV